jgi:hypothetical protein
LIFRAEDCLVTGGHQLLVARGPARLAPGEADLWDSGHVETMSSREMGNEFADGTLYRKRLSFNGEGHTDPR